MPKLSSDAQATNSASTSSAHLMGSFQERIKALHIKILGLSEHSGLSDTTLAYFKRKSDYMKTLNQIALKYSITNHIHLKQYLRR